MNNYRTEKYRIYPDKLQKDAICKMLDRADDAFDELANAINALMESDPGINAIEDTVRDFSFTVKLNNLEACTVKNTIKKLIPKLIAGEIKSILPRNRYRGIRTLEVTASLKPASIVSIESIGEVPLAFYRPLPDDACVFRVILESDCCGERFYLLYNYCYESADVAPHPVNPDLVLGIDYKQNGLYVDSDGNSAGYPGFRRIVHDKIRRYYENITRFKKGSRRWRKHESRLLKLERRIENQRSDWQHKKAEELAKSFDAVCQETLDFKSMILANPGLAAKIYDNDPSSFSRILTQKMGRYGKSVVRIPQFFPSSQICSFCGNVFGRRPLEERVFACPFCGKTIERDVNAARNIKEEGLRLIQAA